VKKQWEICPGGIKGNEAGGKVSMGRRSRKKAEKKKLNLMTSECGAGPGRFVGKQVRGKKKQRGQTVGIAQAN